MAKLSKAALALEIVRIPPNGLQPFADLQKAAIRVLHKELGSDPQPRLDPVFVGQPPYIGTGGMTPWAGTSSGT